MNAEQTLTDVLRGHWSASTHTDSKPFVDKCDGCGEVIFSWDDPMVRDGHEHLAAHQAKALAAAGWVKPRTITTVEELDALPDDSVVLDEMDGPLIKVGSWFHSPTDEMKAHSIIFPAILLYEP